MFTMPHGPLTVARSHDDDGLGAMHRIVLVIFC